jgi:uncharacterized iron-regulated membrane protein
MHAPLTVESGKRARVASLRGWVRQLHLWLGLSLGALLVLLGLTGSALVFYQDIDGWLHPEVRSRSAGPGPGWTDPVWDRALATVRGRWPERQGAWRFEATDDAGPIPARYLPLRHEHTDRMVMVWLSPDGRQVLREAEWGTYAMTWLYDLHMALLAGETGQTVVGGAGLVLLLLLLSGLWAWWPKGRFRPALHFKRGAAALRRLHDLHKWAGLVSLPLLLMLTVTGVMLALPRPSNALLAATVGPVSRVVPPPVVGAAQPPIPLAQALQAAHRVMPQARLAWMEAPGPGRGAYMVRVQQPGDPSRRFPHSYVWVHPATGAVLAVQDRERFGASNVVNNWLHPLHDASAGGGPLRALVALTGLFPAALFVTGLLRWRLRRLPRRHDRLPVRPSGPLTIDPRVP